MTKEEALQIIDRALATVQGTREVHVKLQEAINLLKEDEKGTDTEPG